MKRTRWLLILLLSAGWCRANDDTNPFSSLVTATGAGDLVLQQQVRVRAPISSVWDAYTTSDGWMAWAAPAAEVELKVGGTILTAYGGEIGGEHTNTLRILAVATEELLIVKADVSQNWPEILREDADRLMNVILFESLSEEETMIRSYGIGYRDTPEYQNMMDFFISANESLFANLVRYLEQGEQAQWSE